MRILTFTTLFPSSVNPAHGIFVYQRMAPFARCPGVDVEVISPIPYVPAGISARGWRDFAQTTKEERVGEFRVHHPRYLLLPKVSMPAHGMLMYLGARRLAMQLSREKRFDCIDAHYVYPDGFAAVMVAKLLRIPVVVSARGTDINLFASFATIQPMIRWTLQHCSGIVSVSTALKKRMLELGAPERKIEVIGNGIDAARFRIIERSSARRALGLPENGPILVSVASLREAKGQQHLVSAVARIASKYPGLKLYLIGEGPNRTKLEQLTRDMGLQAQIVLAGSRNNDEIPLWFNAADVSMLASAREGWPNVLLESLACGTPVIASPVGEIPEILASPEFGMVANPDPVSLAAAIDTCLGKSWNREALSRYARQRPWEKVASEVEAYFKRIIQ
jgi:glycosyltransferase involved in cell wall biosynthesis